MKCEDFKKYMADLCDKQTDPAITEACRQHMKECAACRAYYEDFMHTVNLLTPKHAPRSGKPNRPSASLLFRRRLTEETPVTQMDTNSGSRGHLHGRIRHGTQQLLLNPGRGCSFHPPHFRPVYQEFTQCGQLLHVGLRPYYA